jgi:hypothetical protein
MWLLVHIFILRTAIFVGVMKVLLHGHRPVPQVVKILLQRSRLLCRLHSLVKCEGMHSCGLRFVHSGNVQDLDNVKFIIAFKLKPLTIY